MAYYLCVVDRHPLLNRPRAEVGLCRFLWQAGWPQAGARRPPGRTGPRTYVTPRTHGHGVGQLGGGRERRFSKASELQTQGATGHRRSGCQQGAPFTGQRLGPPGAEQYHGPATQGRSLPTPGPAVPAPPSLTPVFRPFWPISHGEDLGRPLHSPADPMLWRGPDSRSWLHAYRPPCPLHTPLHLIPWDPCALGPCCRHLSPRHAERYSVQEDDLHPLSSAPE